MFSAKCLVSCILTQHNGNKTESISISKTVDPSLYTQFSHQHPPSPPYTSTQAVPCSNPADSSPFPADANKKPGVGNTRLHPAIAGGQAAQKRQEHNTPLTRDLHGPLSSSQSGLMGSLCPSRFGAVSSGRQCSDTLIGEEGPDDSAPQAKGL